MHMRCGKALPTLTTTIKCRSTRVDSHVQALMHNFFDGSCSDVWCCGVMLYIMVTGAPSGDPSSCRSPLLVIGCSRVILY